MQRNKLIEKYFQGTITSDELDVLNMELDNDAKFKKEFANDKEAQLAVKHSKREEIRTRLKPKIGEWENEINSRKIRRRRNWSLAASMLLIMGLGWYITTLNSSTNLYEEYYQTYPNEMIVITRDSPDNLETRAFTEYEAGNYEESTKFFLQMKDEGASVNIDFYLGISYLEQGKTSEAIIYFDEVIAGEGKFESQALWYSALANIKDNDIESAKSSLKLLQDRNDFKVEEARELLTKLNLNH